MTSLTTVKIIIDLLNQLYERKFLLTPAKKLLSYNAIYADIALNLIVLDIFFTHKMSTWIISYSIEHMQKACWLINKGIILLVCQFDYDYLIMTPPPSGKSYIDTFIDTKRKKPWYIFAYVFGCGEFLKVLDIHYVGILIKGFTSFQKTSLIYQY